jgi:alkanesulfonate monooxygenase SsuD/methylene tetrahydromethanopterin reductase-like flavin-dependent oxidoreductase (luciferase family)
VSIVEAGGQRNPRRNHVLRSPYPRRCTSTARTRLDGGIVFVTVTRVGIALLPEMNPATDDRWARVERLGFAHAWCFDHLAWRDLAGSPWHATVPTLVAAALSTSTLPIGTFVASPNYRHPVLFAKELMTLDVMSAGRLQLAIGPGTSGYDAAILGDPPLSPKERMDRYTEFVTLLDLLLTQPRTTWSGTWFTAVDAPVIPGPVQQPRPPFLLAANGPRGMRLALRQGQGWVTSGAAAFGAEPPEWWDGVAEAARRFEAIAAAGGGVPPRFRRYLDVGGGPEPATSADQLAEHILRAGELGFTDVVIPWARPTEPFAGSEDVLERLADRLDDAGELTAG